MDLYLRGKRSERLTSEWSRLSVTHRAVGVESFLFPPRCQSASRQLTPTLPFQEDLELKVKTCRVGESFMKLAHDGERG